MMIMIKMMMTIMMTDFPGDDYDDYKYDMVMIIIRGSCNQNCQMYVHNLQLSN